jgi:hypothetical protein
VIVTVGLIYVGIRQAKLTKEALIADKGAFVFAKGLNGFWERDSSNGQFNWRFRPLWENSGEAPTKNMIMHTACVLQDTELQRGFNFSHATTDIGTALLPPKTSNFGGIAPPAPGPAISPQDILDVQNGRKFLYLWGWARYNDVFPNTPRHITRFAWAIVPIGNPLIYDSDIPAGQHGNLSFTNIWLVEGNSADDESDQRFWSFRPMWKKFRSIITTYTN